MVKENFRRLYNKAVGLQKWLSRPNSNRIAEVEPNNLEPNGPDPVYTCWLVSRLSSLTL